MENLRPIDPSVIKPLETKVDKDVLLSTQQINPESPARRISRRSLRRMRQANGRSPYLGQH